MEEQQAGGTIRPRGSLVLVKEHESKEETLGSGIIIPLKVSNEGIVYATVVKIGPGRLLESGGRAKLDDLKVNDVVMIQTQRAMPLSVADRKTFLLNEQDILAVIDKETE